MAVYLQEAFQKLKLLESEDFDLSSSMDSAELQDFLGDNEEVEDDTIDIIDDDAETEEDVEESYEGKIICECPICHNKFYKDPDEITMDVETEKCNVDEECPICFSTEGYDIIGKVEPLDQAEEEELFGDEDVTVSDDDEDGDIEVDGVEVDTVEDDDDEVLESYRRRKLREMRARRRRKFREDFESATIETEDQIMTMDSDDNGKITVTTEPKHGEEEVEDFGSGEEVLAPLDDEDVQEIADNQGGEEEEQPEEIEYDVDEFDEKSFDDLGESYLKKVYENVNSYKTTKVSSKRGKIVVEGVINFKSGKTKKTSFIFESYKATKTGRVKFIGENAQITRGKKAFTVTGNIRRKKFIAESLNYNYTQKDKKGRSNRLYGTVRK